MAKTVEDLSPLITPRSQGGVMRMPERGVGVVSGTTKIDTIAAPCRVYLHQSTGMLVDYMRSDASGVYSFVGLPVGDYYLVIADDSQGTRRSKVEHVIVT